MTMSKGTRFLLFSLATLMDMVASTMLFVAPIRAAQLGASYSVSAAQGVAWSLGAASIVFLGRYVTPRNAGSICIAACFLQAGIRVALIIFARTPTEMLGFLFAAGMTHAMFFTPYQVFFKAAESSRKLPLAVSVAIYTFAWSTGVSLGPLWSGFLIRETLGSIQGWQLCLLFTAVVLTFMGFAIGVIKRRQFTHVVPGSDMSENSRPDFAKVAWLAAFCGGFAFSMVRGIFPAGAVKIGLPENILGGVLFTVGIIQALSALSLSRIHFWMYKPRILASVGLLGVMGMAFFLTAFRGIVPDAWLTPAFFIGAFMFGLYSGSFYFYAVYHCLAHPSRAGTNIAMNECMLATSNVIGLLLGGAVADIYGINSPFLMAAVLIILFTTVQVKRHSRAPWPLSPVAERG